MCTKKIGFYRLEEKDMSCFSYASYISHTIRPRKCDLLQYNFMKICTIHWLFQDFRHQTSFALYSYYISSIFFRYREKTYITVQKMYFGVNIYQKYRHVKKRLAMHIFSLHFKVKSILFTQRKDWQNLRSCGTRLNAWY